MFLLRCWNFPITVLPFMATAETNRLALAAGARSVRPRLFAAITVSSNGLGHSRSRPAALDGTYRPNFDKPVAPTELPTELTTTSIPLEPAREPVPGAIPA